MPVIDPTLDADLTVDNSAIINQAAATAGPGGMVRVPPGKFGTGGIITSRVPIVGKGPGETIFKVIREASPLVPGEGRIQSNGTFLSFRHHMAFIGADAYAENIRIEGTNAPVGPTALDPQAPPGSPQYHGLREFEHAFAFFGVTRGKLLGCRADYVWGDGWFVGNDFGNSGVNPSIDFMLDDFESKGVGRQVGAVSAHISSSGDLNGAHGIIKGHKVLGVTRRAGIDIEPDLGRPVKGLEFVGFDISRTHLHPFAVGGHGNVQHLWLHDNKFAGNEVSFVNSNTGVEFADIRYERNTHTGGVGPGVRFANVKRPVILDNSNTRLGSNPNATPAFRIKDCPDVFIQRNKAFGSALCIGPQGTVTGTISASPGQPGENTHVAAAGGQNLVEPVMVTNPPMPEPAPPTAPVPPPPPPTIPPVTFTPIDLNTASMEEIAALPATVLGKKKAALVKAMQPNIGKLDDLLPLIGIGPSNVAAIRASGRTVQK
jgi:hypothetical protein